MSAPGGWGPSIGRRSAGQALVELALILPLLLLLTAGLVELGRVFMALSTVEAGAYRGAVFAAFSRVNAMDEPAVRTAVVSDWAPFPVTSTNPAVTALRRAVTMRIQP